MGINNLFNITNFFHYNRFHYKWTSSPWNEHLNLLVRIKLLKFISKYSAPSVYRQPRLSPKFSSVLISPIKNTLLHCQTQLPPSATGFQTQSRKTNLNSPVNTNHNYLLTAVYWSVIMECQNWSSDTVIDLIVEGQNRWSVVLIRIITRIYFSSDYICTFNPE
jgi:hypothetical protein